MSTHWYDDLNEWRSRLDGVEATSSGIRAICPAHADNKPSLDVDVRNGKVVWQCRAGCEQMAVVEALDEGDDVDSAHIPLKSEAAPPLPAGFKPGKDAIQNLADYCDVDRTMVAALPVEDGGKGEPVFTWPSGARKVRHWSGDAKTTWHPNVEPRFIWPVDDPMPPEIWTTEGEMDAVALRGRGIDAYSLGASGEGKDVDDWRALRALGVERVVIAGDNDKAGITAVAARLEAALEAGLDATVHLPPYDRINGPFLKDWRDWCLAHPGEDVPAPGIFRRSHVLGGDGWLADLLEGGMVPPQPQKLLGYLHATDHTILFGDGGTGKGVIAAYWIAELIRIGHSILLIDYEGHARGEWLPRVIRFLCGHDQPHGFGMPLCQEAKDGIQYVTIIQPSKPLWDALDKVFEKLDELTSRFPRRSVYAVIDSVVYACSGMKAEASETAAKYSQTLTHLDLPTLSLAHTIKADADPRHPFGSVFWSNGARQTIGVSTKGEAQDSPRLIKSKKANQGVTEGVAEVPWDWVTGDLPPSLTFQTASLSPADYADEVMTGQGWMDVDEVLDAVKAAGMTRIKTQRSMKRILDNDPLQRFEKDGDGRGSKHKYRRVTGPTLKSAGAP